MAILSLIFKRAWQAQFLRHALVHKTKNVYFFKMYKWYYYHILIFLMVSDLEKSLKSFLSRFQSSLGNIMVPFWQVQPLKKVWLMRKFTKPSTNPCTKETTTVSTTAGGQGGKPSFSRPEVDSASKSKKKSKRDQQQKQSSSTLQGNSTSLGKFFATTALLTFRGYS